MKPAKPAEPVAVQPGQSLILLARLVESRFRNRNGLTDVPPVPLMPEPGILSDPQGLL
jgi:hypothetical protein